jgi:hypothetical protein
MTRCLRVRVGPTAYLLPSDSVGAIRLYRQDIVRTGRRRVIDARRMKIGSGQAVAASPASAVAVEWIGADGRIVGLVLVDEVEGLADIDAAEIGAMPHSAHSLASMFDGFWYDRARTAFLLRVRAARLTTFAEMRQLARVLAPLCVAEPRR